MFKRILVPLDGSARAERALPVAIRLARASGGTIFLLRVVSTAPESMPSAPAKPTLVQTVGEADIALAESYLTAVAASEDLKDMSVRAEAFMGLVAPTILSTAEAQFIDIIVMCSHGFTGAKRWVLGSISEKVARSSNIPVLVLRENGSMLIEQPPEAASLRVLVPLDGSENALAALAPAGNLASALAAPQQGSLHLLHVVKARVSVHDAKTAAGRVAARTRATAAKVTTTAVHAVRANHEPQIDLDAAKHYLEEVVARIRDRSLAPTITESNLAVTWSVASEEDIAQSIIHVGEHGEHAQDGTTGKSASVIAMTTHGHNSLQPSTMGTITGRVLQASHLPLLIVRPGARWNR